MDFQHRPGGKTGSGGVASASESNRDRRERLRQLALEDPYFMKNHLGSYECKLCLTLHNNEVRGRARRAAKEAKEAPAQPAPEKVKVEVKKFVKIGRPGYKGESEGGIAKAAVPPQIDYPEIAESIMPRHRFMSAYEQRIEPPDRRWQYLLMAAEPYETIAFKVRPGKHLGEETWESSLPAFARSREGIVLLCSALGQPHQQCCVWSL
uniref:Splicing factor 3a subunit 2 n=1 Tax=Cyanistes caeruleus TaxID=156563 RepID=A0A8C0TZD7_CYACU